MMAIYLDNNIMQPLDGQWRHINGSNHHAGKAYPGDRVIIVNPDSVRGRREWVRNHVGHKATVVQRKRQIPPWTGGLQMVTLYYLKCECGAEGIVEVGFIEPVKE